MWINSFFTSAFSKCPAYVLGDAFLALFNLGAKLRKHGNPSQHAAITARYFTRAKRKHRSRLDRLSEGLVSLQFAWEWKFPMWNLPLYRTRRNIATWHWQLWFSKSLLCDAAFFWFLKGRVCTSSVFLFITLLIFWLFLPEQCRRLKYQTGLTR